MTYVSIFVIRAFSLLRNCLISIRTESGIAIQPVKTKLSSINAIPWLRPIVKRDFWCFTSFLRRRRLWLSIRDDVKFQLTVLQLREKVFDLESRVMMTRWFKGHRGVMQVSSAWGNFNGLIAEISLFQHY